MLIGDKLWNNFRKSQIYGMVLIQINLKMNSNKTINL